jgi:gamma-polyglutamate biosynthesis protein CapA
MYVKRFLSLACLIILLSGCSSAGVFNEGEKLMPREANKSSLEEFFVPEVNSARILHFGDIMLDRNVKRRIDENGTDYLFGKLAGEHTSANSAQANFFSGYDIVTANLEGPFADWRRDTTKEIAFRFDPDLIPMLQKYNFNLFTLANNHSLDMGRAGFAESKDNLTAAGIDFYGIGYGVGDESLIFREINNLKIALLGVDDTLTRVNMVKMNSLLEQAEAEADFTIVNVHWGYEYQRLNSNDRQQNLARQFIDKGADVIVGHHPHVIQEIEVYRDRPIFYSLGNTIFDQYFSEETQEGLALALEIFEEGKLEVELFFLQGEMSQLSLMDASATGALMDQLIQNSRLGEYSFDDYSLSVILNEVQDNNTQNI